MSSLKPDYFIASNGLPNILNKNSNNTRHIMIRHVPTTTTRNRVHNQPRFSNNNCLHKDESGKNHKNKQNFMEARKAPTSTQTIIDNSNRHKLSHINSLKKSKKDLINSEIKASASSHENSTIFLSNNKIEADNKCSWNFERHSKELDDNKYKHQRKYDNKIFRHDLPDRIVLPPLPI